MSGALLKSSTRTKISVSNFVFLRKINTKDGYEADCFKFFGWTFFRKVQNEFATVLH